MPQVYVFFRACFKTLSFSQPVYSLFTADEGTKIKWNEREISVWNMEDARMEDFRHGMEDNLPYQFHTRFRTWHLQKIICV